MELLFPLPGESVGQFLRRASARAGLRQTSIAERVTLRSGGAWVVTQSFISDLMRDGYPPRSLLGRKTASEDPRYAAIAEVLKLDPHSFIVLVERRQLQGEPRRKPQERLPCVATVPVEVRVVRYDPDTYTSARRIFCEGCALMPSVKVWVRGGILNGVAMTLDLQLRRIDLSELDPYYFRLPGWIELLEALKGFAPDIGSFAEDDRYPISVLSAVAQQLLNEYAEIKIVRMQGQFVARVTYRDYSSEVTIPLEVASRYLVL